MSIDERLKEIVKATLPDYSYIYENWYDADQAVSRVSLPAVIHILPVSGSIERHNGRKSDTENCALAFIDKVPRNALGEDNAKVFQTMKDAAFAFLAAVEKSGYFEPLPDVVKYQVICEQFADIVTGIMITPTLKETRHC
jgi:hypothetical protein